MRQAVGCTDVRNERKLGMVDASDGADNCNLHRTVIQTPFQAVKGGDSETQVRSEVKVTHPPPYQFSLEVLSLGREQKDEVVVTLASGAVMCCG